MLVLFKSQDQFIFYFLFLVIIKILLLSGKYMNLIVAVCLNEIELRHYSFSIWRWDVFKCPRKPCHKLSQATAYILIFIVHNFRCQNLNKQATMNRLIESLGTGRMPHAMTKTYVIYPFECLFIFSFWCNVLMPRLCLG